MIAFVFGAKNDVFPRPACGERVRVRGCLCSGTSGESPSPGLLRNPTSPRKRGEVIYLDDRVGEMLHVGTKMSGGYGVSSNGRERRSMKAVRIPADFAPMQ